jgi:transposase
VRRASRWLRLLATFRSTTGRWVTGVKADKAERGMPDASGLLPLTAAERAELTKLRRENAKLRVEREFLKKVVMAP